MPIKLWKFANTSAARPGRLHPGEQGQHFAERSKQLCEETVRRCRVPHWWKCRHQAHSLRRPIGHRVVKRACLLTNLLESIFCMNYPECLMLMPSIGIPSQLFLHLFSPLFPRAALRTPGRFNQFNGKCQLASRCHCENNLYFFWWVHWTWWRPFLRPVLSSSNGCFVQWARFLPLHQHSPSHKSLGELETVWYHQNQISYTNKIDNTCKLF